MKNFILEKMKHIFVFIFVSNLNINYCSKCKNTSDSSSIILIAWLIFWGRIVYNIIFRIVVYWPKLYSITRRHEVTCVGQWRPWQSTPQYDVFQQHEYIASCKQTLHHWRFFVAEILLWWFSSNFAISASNFFRNW